MKRFFLLLVWACYACLSNAQTTGSINGMVRDAINGRPVEGATVLVDQLKRPVTADSLGRFSISTLPVGFYSVTVSAVGYETQTKYNLPISSGNTNEVSFDLLRAGDTLSNVTITSTRRTARATSLETPLSVQRLTTEEIKSNPGGNFDISRVVQSLPGITGSDGIGNGYRNDILFVEVHHRKMCIIWTELKSLSLTIFPLKAVPAAHRAFSTCLLLKMCV